MTTRDSAQLSLALLIDAIASGATGLLLVGGSVVLSPLLGLPTPLMAVAGLLLLPFALLVLWTSRQQRPAAATVWLIVIVNLAWVAGSFVTLGLIEPAPTFLGYLFIVAQALVVLVFAVVQWLGLRKSARSATAPV